MGYMQVLLIITSIMVFGAFNLFVQTTSIENLEIQAVNIALLDMYEYGKGAQNYYDTTSTYIGYDLEGYQTVTPYGNYLITNIGNDEIIFRCTVLINGSIYDGTVNRTDYTIIKIEWGIKW